MRKSQYRLVVHKQKANITKYLVNVIAVSQTHVECYWRFYNYAALKSKWKPVLDR